MLKLKKLSDSELIGKVLKGELDAFEQIVVRYQEKILNHTFKILKDYDFSQDATQDTFIKFYENLKRFDRSKRLGPWLYKIATNTSYDIIKKNKRVVSLDREIPSQQESPIDALINKEKSTRLKNAMDKLPEKYKKLLLSRYFENLSYKAMAKKFGVPINTIRTRIRRGKAYLAKIYEKK
jgi:RNA polymerase sigma-70 factor (ECF subfamily)